MDSYRLVILIPEMCSLGTRLDKLGSRFYRFEAGLDSKVHSFIENQIKKLNIVDQVTSLVKTKIDDLDVSIDTLKKQHR